MHASQAQYNSAVRIVSALRDNGFEAFFAGGWVRDFVMGVTDKSDIDIATNAVPEDIRRIFKRTVAVGEQFGVMIVVDGDMQFEVATFRTDVGIKDGRHPESVVYTDAKNDALRRDFTINGMFYDPLTNEVIDYVNGQLGINERVITAIGDPDERFREDYLRMIRAVRFAARFEYDIEKNTFDAIKRNAQHITIISAERIFAEVSKMLTGKNPGRSLELLHNTGLLAYILPEVESLRGVEQPAEFHPEGDVFVHTVKTLDSLPAAPSLTLSWAALLHDIGKPATMTFTDRIRFNNHNRVGAGMAEDILKRLRAPNALTDAVAAMVENHMNFMNVCKMRLSTLKKFLSRETIQDELVLHLADCRASHGMLSNYDFVKERLETFKPDEIKPKPFVTGKDLIRMGLTPGPLFGKILGEVYDLQLEDKVTTRQEAIDAVHCMDIVKKLTSKFFAPPSAKTSLRTSKSVSLKKHRAAHTAGESEGAPATMLVHTCLILLICMLISFPAAREYNSKNYGIPDDHYQGILFSEVYKKLTSTKVNYPGLWIEEGNNFALGLLPDRLAADGFSGIYGWGDIDIAPGSAGLWLGRLNIHNSHIDAYDEFDILQRFDMRDYSLRGAVWVTPLRNATFSGASAAFDIDHAYTYYGKAYEGHVNKLRIYLNLTCLLRAGNNYWLRVGMHTYNNHITDPYDGRFDNKRLFTDGFFIGLLDNNMRTLELHAENTFAVNNADEKFDTISIGLRHSQGWTRSYMRHVLFTGIKAEAGVSIISDVYEGAGSFQYLHYLQSMTNEGRMTYIRLTAPIIADIDVYRSLRCLLSISPRIAYLRINSAKRQHSLKIDMPEAAISFRGLLGEKIDFAVKPSLGSDWGVSALEVKYRF